MTKLLVMKSPLGDLTLVEREDALIGVHLPSSDDAPPPATPARTALLAESARQLDEYFAGKRVVFDLPLAPRGTTFQERVWRALLAIPYGVTCSYGDLARMIEQPTASRAVGAANGKNPIAIIVPCHRVIGANGSLTGYGGGLPTKQWLLAHEREVNAGAGRTAAAMTP
jgi:methylated-DNA-[protein]-cysteine S-methyltransferase